VLDDLGVSLFSHFLDDVAVGTDDHQSGPIVKFERIPNIKLAVVDAGVLDVISDHSLSQDLHSFLAIELGAVDTDESDFWEVFEFGFKFLKLSQDMDAIDAAASPEVYDKDLAFELIVHGE